MDTKRPENLVYYTRLLGRFASRPSSISIVNIWCHCNIEKQREKFRRYLRFEIFLQKQKPLNTTFKIFITR